MTAETMTPMQQELLGRADAIFASAGRAVGKATEFASEQVPDIAMQYIMYYRMWNSVVVAVCLTLVIFSSWLTISVCFKNKYKLKDSSGGDWHDARNWGIILGTVASIFSMLLLVGNLKSFILVWFAPKVFLIEQMVHLAETVH